jgi:FkbM family methyltransferase
LRKDPDTLALDVDTNIGTFSLFAAKLGHNVVAVEPFYDNVVRIHKAAKSEGLDKRITLVTNALSDSRHEIMSLTPDSSNIGRQSLFDVKPF